MVLTGLIRRTGRETRHTATSTTHLTRHGMGSNPDLRDDTPATNRLSLLRPEIFKILIRTAQ